MEKRDGKQAHCSTGILRWNCRAVLLKIWWRSEGFGGCWLNSAPGRLRQILRLVARAGSVAERGVRYIFMISICSVTCVFHLGNFYRFMEFARVPIVLMEQNIFLELQQFYRIRFIYLSSILK